MNKIFILLLFLTSLGSFAQTTYFFNKKGEKTVMRDDTVEILVVDDRISYAEVGKSWEKYIRFKDLDYAIVGPHYFKSFKLINAKGKSEKETAYFVLAETKDKKLLSYTVTVIGKYGSSKYYNIYCIDNNNNILDYVKLNESFVYKGARMKISPMINKHFSDCPEVMSEFSKFEDTDEKHLNVLGFFDSQRYIKCN